MRCCCKLAPPPLSPPPAAAAAHTWARLCLQMARGEATRRRKRNQEKAALFKGQVRVQKPLHSV